MSKCHFVSVVPWRDILKYLQKCEGCTHFYDTLYKSQLKISHCRTLGELVLNTLGITMWNSEMWIFILLYHHLISDLKYILILLYSIFSCIDHYKDGVCPRGVMVKVLDCGIVVCEFVLQLRYYVHFRSNTLGKGMSPLILQAMG